MEKLSHNCCKGCSAKGAFFFDADGFHTHKVNGAKPSPRLLDHVSVFFPGEHVVDGCSKVPAAESLAM